MKIALLCGGPSLERGISLNSARSVMDHLEDDGIEVVPIYFDLKKRSYLISKAQLYSNTPSDFDFKLAQTARSLNEKQMVSVLKKTDIVFPAMHGAFAEDGGIQAILEKHNIPFVGTSSDVCKKVFDKYIANEYIRENGFHALPSAVLGIYRDDHETIVKNFFKEHKITRAIVKPAKGGSSIGVFSVRNEKEALEKVRLIFSKRMDTRVVIEPFAEGVEFTSIILQNEFGQPVAILPTEIQTDYSENQVFDFRKKYLPTRQVTYKCPPSFSNEAIEKIQIQAEQLFSLFGMRDFARFDGWLFPDGKIWFSDFNPISGMEQNSFLFQQASRIGMSHRSVLRFIVKCACKRYGILFPKEKEERERNVQKDRRQVNVIFGGSTSERQVSLMSGTNVWLKFRRSKQYDPKPFLLDKEGFVWQLPYALTLNHTVEEIAENCCNAPKDIERLKYLEKRVQKRLGIDIEEAKQALELPKKMKLEEFIMQSEFIFLALHGGDGESGVLQEKLAEQNVLFNGSRTDVSRLCMDKCETSKAIDKLNINGVIPVPKKLIRVKDLEKLSDKDMEIFWSEMLRDLDSKTLIVKPRADGCSSGIARLFSAMDLKLYVSYVLSGEGRILKDTFKNQKNDIEMPSEAMEEILFEKFIETDVVRVKGGELKHHRKTGWIEITVGILEQGGSRTVFDPSITIAEGEVLTVEEKFQGGTGINITPPPPAIVKQKALKRSKEIVRKIVRHIGIRGYARVDAFMHIDTGNIMVIELNTLPALTPSTVLYQQALSEDPPIYPKELLESIINSAGY